MKRRRILMALHAVVIESVAEGSLLHCAQYHIETGRKPTPWCYVFFFFHTYVVYLSTRKISRSARNDDTGESLATNP